MRLNSMLRKFTMPWLLRSTFQIVNSSIPKPKCNPWPPNAEPGILKHAPGFPAKTPCIRRSRKLCSSFQYLLDCQRLHSRCHFWSGNLLPIILFFSTTFRHDIVELSWYIAIDVGILFFGDLGGFPMRCQSRLHDFTYAFFSFYWHAWTRRWCLWRTSDWYRMPSSGSRLSKLKYRMSCFWLLLLRSMNLPWWLMITLWLHYMARPWLNPRRKWQRRSGSICDVWWRCYRHGTGCMACGWWWWWRASRWRIVSCGTGNPQWSTVRRAKISYRCIIFGCSRFHFFQ